MSDVTQILERVERGDGKATEESLPLVYGELRKLAAGKMAQERPGQTLQPTALVHEAWLRLVGKDGQQEFQNRAHFFAAAAEAMRRILIERARRRKVLEKGGYRTPEECTESKLVLLAPAEELLAVHKALHGLATGRGMYNSDGHGIVGLVSSGSTLYGTAGSGGRGSVGTVFSISLLVTPPQLTIAASEGNVILTWPTNATGFTLQSSTNLGPSAIWTTNSPAPGIVAGQNTVTNPITGTRQFFRLIQ
jgi:RNA polymerase sigma factor (TIGR02999 family)